MAGDDSLKRLGGGRWETRDGRFAIEPQSGTWVVVDSTQTDDLGLPLVRGPFGSLTAAKEAIETARTTGPAESPLAERLKKAKSEPKAKPAERDRGGDKKAGKTAASRTTPEAAEPPEPPEPPQPRWMSDLPPARRREARDLIDRLARLGIEDPEPIARAEVVRDEPAVTRLALERAIQAAIASSRSPSGAGRAVVKVVVDGRDAELGVRWRLVDERGRRIADLDVPD